MLPMVELAPMFGVDGVIHSWNAIGQGVDRI